MAVAENGVASSGQHFETTDLERSNDKSEKAKDQGLSMKTQSLQNHSNNGADSMKPSHQVNGAVEDEKNDAVAENGGDLTHKSASSNGSNDDDRDSNLTNGEGLKKEIRDLEEMLSKLNPMAKEFVPPSLTKNRSFGEVGNNNSFGYVNNFLIQPNAAGNVNTGRRRRNNYGQGKRRMNSRTSMAQREEVIRRTVYVSDIDQQVTEEQLAALFINCGQVVDCRVCGDPNSILRFAFIEFTDEEGARNALTLSGTMLGYYPVRVLPSKTAIAPVNPTFLPKSEDEREMCARTVYCTNIDKKVTQADVKLFFESFCGEVHRLRLLGDYHHSTRIAFVEFVVHNGGRDRKEKTENRPPCWNQILGGRPPSSMAVGLHSVQGLLAESAIAALNCSGAVLGTLPIRVSPSKTPVRPRPPRSPLH
ncbi:hypothetical protein Cgig2_016035 [Carnegiea gigantea]|uniref:RRM domain-containing protein n=1 Tax=Carnegiea gigantea TaxID=171969 RepID=A0A9Q1QLL9_9CARY|nr:hypothetical protein Cgig2_016035 [Carnegiea gigantea]